MKQSLKKWEKTEGLFVLYNSTVKRGVTSIKTRTGDFESHTNPAMFLAWETRKEAKEALLLIEPPVQEHDDTATEHEDGEVVDASYIDDGNGSHVVEPTEPMEKGDEPHENFSPKAKYADDDSYDEDDGFEVLKASQVAAVQWEVDGLGLKSRIVTADSWDGLTLPKLLKVRRKGAVTALKEAKKALTEAQKEVIQTTRFVKSFDKIAKQNGVSLGAK